MITMTIKIKKQKGVVLLMSLIMLLLITVIGVSAVRLSMNDTQISGNSIYSSIVFQAAESTLNRSASISDMYDIEVAASMRGSNRTITIPVETASNGGKLSSAGLVGYEGILESPQINTIANSSNFNYQVFKITAESKLQGTSAKDTHTEGRALQIPN